ncbi:sulfotransferase family 2 domain-containing protein [Sagittula sp. SSi028]|uniref:sulfotransferase family 2 domain-containing protein n=1 Tax=Sagittula sp. SSi028 TaxID=3400636 RepID=UPI003AF94B6B
MIVSPGRGYVFVHIPKTGGTSLAAALEARAMADDILIGDTPKAVRRRGRVKKLQPRAAGRLWKHSTLRDVQGVLPDEVLRGLFVFAVVRNPWDRMVSYYHWLRAQTFDHPQVRLAQRVNFAEFVAHGETVAALRASPYEGYTTDAQGVQRCGMFLRLERLPDDLEELSAHLGFRPEVTHLNRSERARDHRTYYSDESAEVVAQICAADIARFGYVF